MAGFLLGRLKEGNKQVIFFNYSFYSCSQCEIASLNTIGEGFDVNMLFQGEVSY